MIPSLKVPLQRDPFDNLPSIESAFDSRIPVASIDDTPPAKRGVFLSYKGEKFNQLTDPPTAIDSTTQFKELFSSVGGLVIRYDLGYRQTAGLLQQTSMRNDVYRASPIEKPADGNDQTSLFEVGNATLVYRDTVDLLRVAHNVIGKNKVMNERGQPVVHSNKSGFSGQQSIWGIVHSAVWNAGIGLPHALDEQGFRYIAVPGNMNPLQHTQLAEDIKAGIYRIDDTHNVEFYNPNLKIETWPFSKLDVKPDAGSPYRSNLLVNEKNASEQTEQPSGFVLKSDNSILDPYLGDSLLKVMRIARGEFYKLSPDNQKVMMSGLAADNTAQGQGLFQQNNAFNALVPIFDALKERTGFSAVEAMTRNVQQTGKRLNEAMKKDRVKEAFLTGPLLNEMVQPLKATRGDNRRVPMPERFNSAFQVNSNTSKAVAYAFDLTDRHGKPLLKVNEQQPFEENTMLRDVQINGDLLNPDMSEPDYVASMLSTAILVAEQTIIEKLLTAIVEGNQKLIPDLKQIFGNDDAERLLSLAYEVPSEKLGRQFQESDEIVAYIRGNLDTSLLIDYANKLDTKKNVPVTPNVLEAARRLEKVGNVLDAQPETSARPMGSRGINAGLPLVFNYMEQNSIIPRFGIF
jgi:hypothetical protein